MRGKPKIAIIFPPQFEPFQCYLSGPMLKALLYRHGYESTFWDANIAFYEWVIGRSVDRLQRHEAVNGDWAYLCGRASKAVESLRKTPKSLLEYKWAVDVVDQYLGLSCLPHVDMGLTQLRVGNRYRSDDIKSYLGQSGNIFQDFFRSALAMHFRPGVFSVYLISLVVIDQLPAAIALAREIKRTSKEACVIIGGPLVSRLHRQLAAIPWIAETFDAIAPGEAYRVLPPLLGHERTDPSHVTPDFSDCDLDRYWSCRRVLPYIVAHGCKWGKCTFCSHHLTYDGYRSSGMTDVLSDLEFLTARHDARHISFCDEYLTPMQLAELSRGVLERGLDIRWSTFVRPERAFLDRELAHRLYESGCRMLMFGLESGSQSVINAMRKGTRVDHFRTILEACKAAGIAIRYDFMVGFPGETAEDAQATYDFIRQNRDVIDTPFSSYSVGAFELRDGIPIEQATERYGIVRRRPLRGDLDDQYDFEDLNGLTEQARADWRDTLIRHAKVELDTELICPQNKTHQLVLKDLYDDGLLELPVLDVRPELFARIGARWAPGIHLARTDRALTVTNHANGGQFELDSSLTEVAYAFERGASLAQATRAQNVWDQSAFARFVDFLYRSNHVHLRSIAPADRNPDLVLEPENGHG